MSAESRATTLGSLAVAAVAGVLASPVGRTLSAVVGKESVATAGAISVGLGVVLVAMGGESWARSAGLAAVGAGSAMLFGASEPVAAPAPAAPPALPPTQVATPNPAHVAGLYASPPDALVHPSLLESSTVPRTLATDERGALYSVGVDGSDPRFMAHAPPSPSQAQQLAARDPRYTRKAPPPRPAAWNGRHLR